MYFCRYIGEEDLEFYKDRVERAVDFPGAGKWQHLMDKHFGDMQYSAWKRHLAVSHAWSQHALMSISAL